MNENVIAGLREAIDDLKAWGFVADARDKGQITQIRERVEDALEVLNTQDIHAHPHDLVPVVRCRDCFAWDRSSLDGLEDDEAWCEFADCVVKGDFFCADGKHKEYD